MRRRAELLQRIVWGWALWAALSSCAASARAEEGDKREPVPPPAKLQEAERNIRTLFGEEFKKTAPEAQLALAKQLLDGGATTKDDPGASYQMLQMAMVISIKNGGLSQAVQAAQALQTRFQVDGLKLRARLNDQAARTATAKEQMLELANSYAACAEEAFTKEEYPAARAAYDGAQRFYRQAGETSLAANAARQLELITVLSVSAERVKADHDKLFANPEDPAANTSLGKYYCLYRGDWIKGLPFLAKSGDPKLAQVAQTELAEPNLETARMIAAGDQWYEKSGSGVKAEQDAMKARAAFWYVKALAFATGLDKIRVEKRLLELQPVIASGGLSSNSPAAPAGTPKNALPTPEELKSLNELGGKIPKDKKTVTGPPEALFEAMLQIGTRMLQAPETWSDADYKARVEADKQLYDLWHKYSSTYVSRSGVLFICGSMNMVRVWAEFVSGAASPQQFIERLKGVGNASRADSRTIYKPIAERDLLHQAIMAYMTRNNAMYPSQNAKLQFLQWLGSQSVSAGALEDARKDVSAKP